MDINLKKILMSVFNLTEKEFHIDLTKEDISCWDSLKHMDLITTLEGHYNINLEMLEILNMLSVREIIQTLESKGVAFEK